MLTKVYVVVADGLALNTQGEDVIVFWVKLFTPSVQAKSQGPFPAKATDNVADWPGHMLWAPDITAFGPDWVNI
jgi:hypothetical protein